MKYKQYADELKERNVAEYSQGGISIVKLAEKHSVNVNTLAKWIKKAKDAHIPSESPAIIDVTPAIRSVANASELDGPETISFRLNGAFEIEVRKESLKTFLEAIRDAGM